MLSSHLSMTAHPPTYFSLMLNVIMVTPQVREKFPLLSHKASHSPLSWHVPCAPTEICSSWHTITSYHLKKSLHGRQQPPFSFSDLHSSGSRDGGAVSSSLHLTSKKTTSEWHRPPRPFFWWVACLMQTHSHRPTRVWRVGPLLLNYPGETLKIFRRWQIVRETLEKH